MFGFKKREDDTSASIFALPDKPVPMPANVGTEPLGTYEALAGELGFEPAQLLEEQLRRFLNEESIPIYNYADVDAYMAALAEEQGKIWIWRPLRERDKPNDWSWEGRQSKRIRDYYGHGAYQDRWSYRPYDRAVPIHILRQVKKIQDKFGDKVLFFVSDYAVPDPDPFIMVTAPDVQKIVFGVWDEPEFGTESEE